MHLYNIAPMKSSGKKALLRILILVIFALALGLLMGLVQNIYDIELTRIQRAIIAVVLIVPFMFFLSKTIK